MKPPLFPLSLALALALAGCDRTATAHDHAASDHGRESGGHDHDHDEAEGPVRYDADHGLEFGAETAAALGLQTAPITERTLRSAYALTATVFDPGPPARATVLLPLAIAVELERHPPAEAQLLSVRRELANALNQVEAVLALPGTPAAGSTVSLTVHGPARPSPALPASALLRTATGTFAYVARDGHLRRTPVQVGASDGDFLALLDGLRPGDVVVTAGVEQLWLTELRLTKGGCHSH